MRNKIKKIKHQLTLQKCDFIGAFVFRKQLQKNIITAPE
jgi:hypothetical protein